MDPSIPGAHVETVLTAGSTVTITGTGFDGPPVNLRTATGNLGPLTPFAFTLPGTAQPGPACVHALDPPFMPCTSSGTDPGGAFTAP